MKKSNSRRIIFYILWGALLFTNISFLGLVISGMIKPDTTANQSELFFYGPIAFAVTLGLMSIIIFIRAINPKRIKELSESLGLELPNTANQTQILRDQFNKLPDCEKRKILVEQRTLVLLILAWVFSESISFAGIIMVMMGGYEDYFIYFSIASILIHLKNFPKIFFKIVDEQIK